MRTDMPLGIGGTATAPSPGWFLRAAEASCVASLIAIRAAATDVTLRSVIDARGLDGTALDELVRWAVEHCPVTDTVSRSVPLEIEIR